MTLADGVWQTVGSAGFSPGVATYTSIALDSNGTPYVAFSDQAHGGKASVMTYNGTKLAARHTFIVNPEGKVVKVYTDVKPNEHSAEVLAALGDLQK